jgi:hypothetical protein
MSPRFARILVAAAVAVTVGACSGGDGGGSRNVGNSGSGNSGSGSANGGSGNGSDPALAAVDRTFCGHMLPLLGVSSDMSLLSSGAQFSGEEMRLFNLALPETFRTAVAGLQGDAGAFDDLGEEGLAGAARAIRRATVELANATSDDLAQAYRDYAEALKGSGLPPGYCEDVSGADFFRGYLDGWLAHDPETGAGDDYALGYDKGLADGWRGET